MNVFVIGITGRTGSRIARLLIDQGHSVSGLYRHPRQIENLEEMGARTFAGDIATISEHEFARVMSFTEVVVFTAGAGDQDDESMIDAVDYGGVKKTIAAMRLAGHSRLLLISVFPEARKRAMPGRFVRILYFGQEESGCRSCEQRARLDYSQTFLP